MYKLNGEDIDVYVVIRGYISRDVILRNYTQDKVKLCGCFKSLCTAGVFVDVNEVKDKINNRIKVLQVDKNATQSY